MTIPRLNRRQWLRTTAGGFGYLAFAGLCAEAQTRQDPLAPRAPHFAPRARRVIFLFMSGGPSQIDMYDPKPALNGVHGTLGRYRTPLLKSPWRFQQHGQSGLWFSELLPHLARQADRLCVVRSMHTDNQSHPEATIQYHTGSFQFLRPSIGSWTLYGLGTENSNLPGFIALKPVSPHRTCGSAFLPAAYQATTIGHPIRQARVANLTSPRLTADGQRRQLDLLQAMNRDLAERQPDDRLEGVIDTFELSFRMQTELPRVLDLSGESRATLDMYGVDAGPTDDFGRQCLLARRFAEAGVRFIELTSTGWDQHLQLTQDLPTRCREIDKPIAALLTDLERRGLLDDTLIVWGGEFGRPPEDHSPNGRGHNHKGFTVWLAGGGVKAGMAYGTTDELGYEAVSDKVHMHDLHATILHLLGLDHERLTYQHSGREVRLTDGKGAVVRELLR